MAGLLAIAGGVFTAITFGLFQALGIEPPVPCGLFVAGGGGLIAVVAVALVYDPRAAPAQQSFDEGLGKLIALLMRLLLPLSVAVLLVYLAFIPFNWREPFENRDVLVIFNAMLFAVVALLVGATPPRGSRWARRARPGCAAGSLALAGLALLVSLYALAAILYRTANDRLTPNRLIFIGWDLANIAILAILLIGQARAGRPRWLRALRRAFAAGAVLYVAWSVAGLLAPPWLFRGDPAATAHLPPSIQQIVYRHAEPILLKCAASPHIYLLQEGQKRWIVDIPTFEAEGYRWSDVRFVPCDDLRLAARRGDDPARHRPAAAAVSDTVPAARGRVDAGGAPLGSDDGRVLHPLPDIWCDFCLQGVRFSFGARVIASGVRPAFRRTERSNLLL